MILMAIRPAPIFAKVIYLVTVGLQIGALRRERPAANPLDKHPPFEARGGAITRRTSRSPPGAFAHAASHKFPQFLHSGSLAQWAPTLSIRQSQETSVHYDSGTAGIYFGAITVLTGIGGTALGAWASKVRQALFRFDIHN